MSFAITNFLKLYARWREDYLTAHPEKRLFPWLFGAIETMPVLDEPILTVGPAAKRIFKVWEDTKIKGVLAVFLVLLALSSSE